MSWSAFIDICLPEKIPGQTEMHHKLPFRWYAKRFFYDMIDMVKAGSTLHGLKIISDASPF